MLCVELYSKLMVKYCVSIVSVYMETSKTVEEKVSQILADIDNLKLYDNIPQWQRISKISDK